MKVTGSKTYSYKGKCDMDTKDSKKLKQLEVKYYEDGACKDFDKYRFEKYAPSYQSTYKDQGKLEFDFDKCRPHPFYKYKYTKMQAMPSAGAVLVVLLLLCCCSQVAL